VQGDFPRVGRAPVLEKIYSLSGSQSEPTIADWNGEFRAAQRNADVGGHVVSALVRVPISRRSVRRQAVEERLKIDTNVLRGILLNEQIRRVLRQNKVMSPVCT
jgi:hypothetical protein